MRQQLTEAMGTSAELVLAKTRRPRQPGQVFVDLELAAPEPTARSVNHSCCHHWIIEVAIGPLSKGVCKQCGEEKLFRNQLRWTEIAPVKVVKDRRQENDDPETPDQRKSRRFRAGGKPLRQLHAPAIGRKTALITIVRCTWSGVR